MTTYTREQLDSLASYSLGQLQALKRALASGSRSVSYEGKSVTYASLTEMKEIIGIVERALMGAPARRRLLARTRGDKAL